MTMHHHRDATIDVARGFIVLIMPAVHTVLLYSTPVVQASWLGILLGLLAEGPGAQLFMLLLGFSYTLGRHKTWSQILQRAFKLLLLAYLLNFFKLVIPYWSGIYPTKLWAAYGVSRDTGATVTLLSMGDILQFAAIAYLVIAFLYSRRRPILWTFSLMGVVTAGSFLCWDKTSAVPGLNYLLALLGGAPPHVFFPVFPWLVYPIAGLLIGILHKRYVSGTLYRWLFIIGITLIILGQLLILAEPKNMEMDFYRTGPGGTLFHLGIVLVWLFLCRIAVQKLRPNPFFQLLSWLSKGITTVYFLQWLVVLWLLPVFGFRQLDLLTSLGTLLLNTGITFTLYYLMGRSSIFNLRISIPKLIPYESENI